MKISLIIPCYNEGLNIPELIDNCNKIISKKNIEIIIVNNGSKDNTKKILNKMKVKENHNLKVISVKKNIGYGNGIISGLNSSTGDVIGWMHADLQVDLDNFLTGVKYFNTPDDNLIVKGNRRNRFFFENLLTLCMSLLATFILKEKLYDINAQPTIITKKFYKKLKNIPNDFSFDLFVYFNAKHIGLEEIRFPVKVKQRVYGVSSWNTNFIAKIDFIIKNIRYIYNLKKMKKCSKLFIE